MASGSRRTPWLRLAGLALAIVLGALPLFAGLLFLAAAPATRRRFRTRYFRLWAGLLADVLRLKLQVSGKMPRPPFLLVANHLSYVDVLVLGSVLPAVFVAKAEVRRWPLLGPLCAAVGTLFLDRRRPRDLPRVLRDVETALDAGLGVIAFPEGTSSAGTTVLPFRSPLLAVAARRGLPVHYAALGYTTPPGSPPADRAVCWWGEMSLLPHLLGLLSLPAVTADLRFGPEPRVGGDRKQLADELRGAVRARLHLPPSALA